MLNQGAEGFEGVISAKKYISITKTSKATATRDLQDLVNKKIDCSKWWTLCEVLSKCLITINKTII